MAELNFEELQRLGQSGTCGVCMKPIPIQHTTGRRRTSCEECRPAYVKAANKYYDAKRMRDPTRKDIYLKQRKIQKAQTQIQKIELKIQKLTKRKDELACTISQSLT